MRILSAAFYKTGESSKGLARPHFRIEGYPLPETKLRKLCDLFKTHAGISIENKELIETIDVKKMKEISSMLVFLTDYYGLDIRSVPDCHHKCLVGEWFGSEYVDYIARKVKSNDT